MESAPRTPPGNPHLDEEALGRIAAALGDLYFLRYEQQPEDLRASLTGNMVAFVFEGGLSIADDWLLRGGHDERLREFRQHFFEVVDPEMTGVVAALAGVPVSYSFYGFDPHTRTTHGNFVLDFGRPRSEYRASHRVPTLHARSQLEEDHPDDHATRPPAGRNPPADGP